MTHLIVAAALTVAQARTPEQQEADIGGRYEAKLAHGVRCQLDIQASGRFTLQCEKEAEVSGRLLRSANWIVLAPLGTADGNEELDYWRTYAVASSMHMEQTRKEHGYYPTVVSPTPPPKVLPKGIGLVTVPVQAGVHQYLVDLRERTGFCASMRAHREPESANSDHPIYQRRLQRSGPGLEWKAFCGADWRPVLE